MSCAPAWPEASAPYAAAVSSGTAGLHLLCIAAGVGPGDEVITSPYSFVASANCAVYQGATPVFADIDPHTLNLDPAAVESIEVTLWEPYTVYPGTNFKGPYERLVQTQASTAFAVSSGFRK